MSEPILQINHLSKTFGSHEVLRDIDFSVNPGDVTSIIGASGSGKSTLLRCINLLETPTSGDILYHGTNIDNIKGGASAYRSHVGMVFQSFNLFNNMTALKNCMIGQTKVLKKSRAEAKASALHYLEKVGMAPYINAKPSQLSGGQKQRVGIARAIVSDPDILLSDEATSALDPETVKSILNLLKDINRKLHITIIMITHQMEVIKSIADRVAIIEHGHIIEQSSVLDLFTSPKTETARNFIGSVSSNTLPEGLKNYHIHDERENADDHIMMRLSFRGDVANEPIIAKLARDYDLEVSILYGTVDFIQGVSFGKLIIDVSGSDSNITAAFNHLHSLPIESEVLGYVSGNI